MVANHLSKLNDEEKNNSLN